VVTDTLILMEYAHIIDASTNLVGISTKPIAGENNGRGDIAVIMFNAGYLHHVGPNRINTSLARSLGSCGFHTLRMDFSGLGDSGANADVQSNAELVRKDAKSAMDFMQSHHGCTRFILFGLCSGAVDSILIAQSDKRVAGLVAVDGFGFRTKRFYIQHAITHIIPRLFRFKHWHRGVSRYAQKVRERLFRPGKNALEHAAYSMTDDGNLTRKTREEVSNILSSLCRHNTKMRFLYTGGVADYYNYSGQFKDMFGNSDLARKISWRYFPQADHLFMLAEHRNQMIDDVRQWVCREFA